MEELKNKNKLYQIYVWIGIVAIGIMAVCVISAVLLRYIFSLSFAFMEEFITEMFTFTTFWAVGICVIENEHVVIDFVYEKMPVKMKYIFSIINYLLMLFVSIVFLYYSIKWVQMVGNKLTPGMKIPSWILYSIQPIGIALSIVCVVAKLFEIIRQHKQRKMKRDSNV